MKIGEEKVDNLLGRLHRQTLEKTSSIKGSPDPKRESQ